MINLKFKWHKAQRHIFFENKARYKFIAKGRRFGMTKGMANFVMKSMLDGVSPILWVDTINSNIDRYVERYFLPELTKLTPWYVRWRQQKKELSIGSSVCDFRSSDQPENIEGFGYALIILNEAGIIFKDEYLWHNTILPMVMDYKSPVIAGGTPKGKNLFFKLCLECEKKDGWSYMQFSSYANPYISRKEIDEIAAGMPNNVKRQEIMGDFIEDGGEVFSNVSACVGDCSNPIPPFVSGLDFAKLQDYTVNVRIDSRNKVVKIDRFNHMPYTLQKKKLINIFKNDKTELVVADRTGVGEPIIDDLLSEDLNIYGLTFTNPEKQKLIENLVLAFENEEVTIPNDELLLQELAFFTYKMSRTGAIQYGAPDGFHDDIVIALALAWRAKTGIGLWHGDFGQGASVSTTYDGEN